MTQSVALEDLVEFADNPDPRCPCVLLLDISGSMRGAPLDALQAGLDAFQQELSKDALASRRVEVAIVTFNNEVKVAQDFVTVDQFTPPQLQALGLTHMGGAIITALDLVNARKAQYRANGVMYYRPWIFLITDGAPQGEADTVVEEAAKRISEEEAARKVAFFAVGVEGADMDRLAKISVRAPVKLTGLNFVEMFVWLSASMQRVSQSRVDDQVALPPPGWGAV